MVDKSWREEFRKYPRMRIESILSCWPVSAREEDAFFSTTKVVGLNGLMFEHSQPLPVGSEHHFHLMAENRIMNIRGKVVFANPLDGGRFDIGVEFTAITLIDRETLEGIFLEKRDQTQVKQQEEP